MSQLYVTIFVFCSLQLALSVYGRVYSKYDHAIFPDSPELQLKISRVLGNNLHHESLKRTTRQSDNRRVTERQQSSMTDEEDPFSGLDPLYPSNQPFNGNQGQWFNNGNQNPQTEQQSFGNRPQQQNQWPNNGGNQGQGFQGNNGGDQGQGFGNRPREQNQWSNNRGNQGQGLQGNNGNNRPNRPNSPTNQNNQNQWPNNGGNQGQGFQGNNGGDQGQGFGNRPRDQNQWSNNGGNQGQGLQGNNGNNRPNILNKPNSPTNQNNQNNQNQNQAQTSTTVVSETQRNECNTRCKGRVTSEFNPVCGNDGQTYQNTRFLKCVADCGIQTEFSYVGTCVPTTQPASVVNPGSSNNSRT